MTKGIYNKRKGISFLSTMSIYFILIVFYTSFHPEAIEAPLSANTVIMVGIYILIGLASMDYKPISMMIERVWNMNCQNGVNADSKLQTIRAFIAMNVHQWNKYNMLYGNIVDNDKKVVYGRKEKFKELIMRIPNGQLNLKQFLWITAYVAYNVIKNNGYIPFLPTVYSDMDFLIDFAGIGFFAFTSGTVIGLGGFMEKIFESIKEDDKAIVEESLRLLEQNIIFGARHFGFLRDVIEMKCEDLPSKSPTCVVVPKTEILPIKKE